MVFSLLRRILLQLSEKKLGATSIVFFSSVQTGCPALFCFPDHPINTPLGTCSSFPMTVCCISVLLLWVSVRLGWLVLVIYSLWVDQHWLIPCINFSNCCLNSFSCTRTTRHHPSQGLTKKWLRQNVEHTCIEVMSVGRYCQATLPRRKKLLTVMVFFQAAERETEGLILLSLFQWQTLILPQSSIWIHAWTTCGSRQMGRAVAKQ